MTGKAKRRARRESGDLTSYEVDNTQGSILWAFNRFRSGILTRLLDDLSGREEQGFSRDECGRVKQALARIVNLSTELPDGGFLRRSVFDELVTFEARYSDWNAVEHSNPIGRAEALKRLRESRKRLSNIIRNNQYILAEELDLSLITSLYGAVEDLVQALPSALSSVGELFGEIARKLPNQSVD